MVRREDYPRREQAYVKHYVLKHYLQQLALKIGHFRPGTTFNYIDGFSGPWQHATEELRDTSPHVALTLLSAARDSLRASARSVELRVRGRDSQHPWAYRVPRDRAPGDIPAARGASRGEAARAGHDARAG